MFSYIVERLWLFYFVEIQSILKMKLNQILL